MSGQQGVLSLCATCRHAEWEKTANGRRHPNGVGQCRYMPPDGPLPKCRSFRCGRDSRWVTTIHEFIAVKAGNAQIYWREHHNTIADPCAAWESK